MPTYEYECMHCGHTFEVFQKITDKPLFSCPKCHKKEAKRLISSGAGIIFKGPGFYATDYRKSEKSKKPKSETQVSCPKAKEGCHACQNKTF